MTTIASQTPLLGGPISRRPWLGPLAVGIGALALCAGDVVLNPYKGQGLTCPFHALTGLWCPICGSSRSLYSLLHGEVRASFMHNPLFLVVLPVVAWQWVAWMSLSVGGPSLPHLRATRAVLITGLSLVLGFWVVRNLPVPALHLLHP